MGLILADHESQFELSRQVPAVTLAALVLLAAGATLFLVARRRGPEWGSSPAGRLSILALASLAIAGIAGSWPLQPDPYWVCGPVLHRWTESELCVDDLRPLRQAVVVFTTLAVAMFVASVVVDRRQASGAPPPGTTR